MTRLSTAMMSAIIFAVIGPAAGAFGLFCYMQIDSATYFSGVFSQGMSLVYVFLIVGAYLAGSIPAAVTGLVFGAIASLRTIGRLASMAIGFSIGFCVCILLELALSIPEGKLAPDLAVPLVGGFSGSMCGLVCRLVGLGPNNSFKPKPLRGSA